MSLPRPILQLSNVVQSSGNFIMLTDHPSLPHHPLPAPMSGPVPDEHDNQDSKDPYSIPADRLYGESKPESSTSDSSQGELFETAPPPWELAIQDDVAVGGWFFRRRHTDPTIIGFPTRCGKH